MRSLSFVVLVTMVTWVSAIPITPAAPRLQQRAEQFRLQGLNEYQIAEQVSNSATASELEPFRDELRKNPLFRVPIIGEDDDLSGDLVPGSLRSAESVPFAIVEDPVDDPMTLFERICALFHAHETGAAYGRKDFEDRRPSGPRNWRYSSGEFRR